MRKTELVAGLVSVVALVAAAPAAADILPVGTWSFNEGHGTVAHDMSLRGNDGTLQGGASWTQGRFQKGVSLGGNDADAVDVPDSRAIDGQNITVSAWVNSSSSPGNFKYVAGKGGNGCFTASYGLYTGPNGGLMFYVSSSQTSFVRSPDYGTGAWDGNWHNVIGTYDGSTVRLYVDGTQVGSGTTDTAPIAYGLPSGNDLQIGNDQGCSGLAFTGKIDEVKVFNRPLGSQEIRAAYQASRALPPTIPFDLIL